VRLAAALNSLRLALAALGLVTITYQFAERYALPAFRPANFFSFFTIQSNLIAIAVLAAAATTRPVDPPRRLLPMRVALVWLAYPLVYLGYTLVRGQIANWYPYPFVDVAHLGYGGVLARSAALLLVGIGLAAAVAAIGNGLGSRAATRAT
jgi:hypothetical protein